MASEQIAPTAIDDERERAAIQRRTLRTLFIGTIPAGAAMSGGFAAAATLGEDLTGSDGLGTFAAACVTVGGALTAVPLASYTSRHGRRPGLALAWSIAAAGAVLCAIAAIAEIYVLLPPGLAGIGAGSAGTLSARYAAADLATDEERAKAISILVWGGTFGSVFGPLLALGPASAAAEAFGLPELAGPYLFSLVLFAVAAVAVDRLLRPDPLAVAGGLGAESGPRRRTAFGLLWSQPPARLAVAAMVVGHGVMVGVMVATPLHMKDGGHELDVVGLVISVHVVGMYMFAPLVGILVSRIGPRLTIAIGGVILFTGAEMAAHTDAEDRAGVLIGLFLVGLGWNFGLVSASTLLTASFSPEDRVPVQGTADLAMTAAGASAGLLSGVILEAFGYDDLSHNAGLFGAALAVIAVMSLLPGRGRDEVSPGD